MTDRDRQEMTKYLLRAQDALQRVHEVAARNGDVDFAFDIRAMRKKLGEGITNVNGGPVTVSARELLGRVP